MQIAMQNCANLKSEITRKTKEHENDLQKSRTRETGRRQNETVTIHDTDNPQPYNQSEKPLLTQQQPTDECAIEKLVADWKVLQNRDNLLSSLQEDIVS